MILNETKGALVERVQKKFAVEATGEYNRATQLAILGWQLSNGMAATGVIDEEGWIALFGSLPKQTKVENYARKIYVRSKPRILKIKLVTTRRKKYVPQ